MISKYENIINAICERFRNHITPLKVVSWLENFQTSDWNKALIVLNSFEYFTTIDIIKEFDNYLNVIQESIDNTNPVYTLPVGEVGKSGLAMIYYLKKTNSFVNHRHQILDKNELQKLKEGDNIILVDDFSGSGKTISDFYSSIKNELPTNICIYALTVVYIAKARDHLKKHGIEIYGNLRYPAFSKRGSVFGYPPRMKAIRDFCFNYGNLLYPDDKRTQQHPLGYANTQALIGFEHAIPNNTLPIIWADKKRTDSNKTWQPIFPRRTQAYIKESDDFKKSSAYWISLLYKLNLDTSLGFEKDKYSKYNFQILSIILLKRRNKSAVNICQFLGINLKEYEAIIEDGIRRNIFNEKEELTENAINIVEQVRKKAKFEKEKYIKPELIIEEDMVYLPKSFLGSS